MSKEIALKPYDVAEITKMSEMAKVLKDHIVKQKLYTTISNRNYAHVEGWQFAGGLLGLFPRITAVENLSTGNEVKWKADAEIVNLKTGEIIGRGFAICSNKESKKKSFDEYAVLSMAQTRAIGKAYRNLIGWVMKLAGYEATPKEEMSKVDDDTESKSAAKRPRTDAKEILLCTNCSKEITKQESDYSLKLYKKSLCRACQKLPTPTPNE